MLHELLIIAANIHTLAAWNELNQTCGDYVREEGMTYYDFCQDIRMALP